MRFSTASKSRREAFVRKKKMGEVLAERAMDACEELTTQQLINEIHRRHEETPIADWLMDLGHDLETKGE